MAWYILLPIFVLLVTVPFFLGAWLGRRLRMPDHGWKIGLIIFSLASAAVVVVTGWPPQAGIDLSGGVVLVYEVDWESMKKEEEADQQQDVPMDRLIQALEKRLNPAGVTGVSLRPYGEGQVEITIPQVRAEDPQLGAEELERVKKILTSVGALEFRILANTRDHPDLIARGQALPIDQTAVVNPQTKKREAWWVPVASDKEDDFASYGDIARRVSPTAEGEELQILVVADPFDVTGDYLVSATPGTDNRGRPCVFFSFNAAGGYRFARLTGNNLPDETQEFFRKLGIVLDNHLQSAPVIQSTISRRGEITGSFTREETEDLAAILNAGMLPAQLNKTPLSEQHIGPLLGRDTIIRGAWAIGISMAIVLLFMIFYYRFAGLVACLAVLSNLLLLVGIMIAVSAEFSLPGIAGLVLTVGMAVDANVLIYERIREERDRGAALRMAIRNGFARALSAIVDANLTTLMIAVILYAIPEASQVRGFAVVLFLGVVLSMYTAIFCARVLFDVAEKRRWITELRMRRLLRTPQFNLLGRRRLGLAVSGLLILAGLVGVVARGRGLLDIDFTGGVSVEVLFKRTVSIADVRQRLEGLPDLAVADVRYGEETPGRRFRVTTSKSEYSPEEAQRAVFETVSAQLDRLVPGQSAAQRRQLLERLGQLLGVLIKEPADSDQYKTAWNRFHELLAESLSGVTDAQRRQDAMAAVDGRLHEVLLTPTELVEERIAGSFPGQLVTNTLEIVDLAPVAEAVAEKARAGDVSVRSPVGPPGSRSAGLGATVAQLALGQTAADDPAGAPSAEPDAGPAEAGAAEPGAEEPPEPGAEEPAEPGAEEPTEPGAEEPPEPGAEEPAEPGAEEPTEPGTAPESPAEPAEAGPAEPAEPGTPGPSAGEPSGPALPPAGPAAGGAPPSEGSPEQPPPGPGAAGQPSPVPEQPAMPDPFAGGTHAVVKFSHPARQERVRELLVAQLGPEPAIRVTNEQYTPGDKAGYDTWEVSLAVPPDEARQAIEAIQAQLESEPYFPSSTTIGSRVAGTLQEKGLLAVLASLVCIVAYLWIRFQRVIYGLAAVVALIHDVLITLGLLALSAYLALIPGVTELLLIDPFKIGLTVLAAFLTIIGYSLNDTIVVFDRIREVKGKAPRLTEEMINSSINQTLARTLLTSMTTLVVVLILYAGGGQPVHTFAFALVIGVVVGTYSSIFVASPFLLWMSRPPKQAQ